MAAKRKNAGHGRLSPATAACVIYGGLILLFFLWQAAPHGFPTVFGARPMLLLPLVVAIAMFEGPGGGAAAGVAAGLLWDLYAFRLFGFHALLLLVLGAAVGLCVRLYLRCNLITAGLLNVAAGVCFCTLEWLCNFVLPRRADRVWWLVHSLLPGLLYTLAIALPLYALVRVCARHLSRRRDAYGV